MKRLLKRAITFLIAIIVCYNFLCSCNKNNMYSIPKIPTTNSKLDANFEILKIRTGYSLSGPSKIWRSNSESFLYLKNLEDVDCYMNTSSKNELLGVKNNNIVFFGIYGYTSSTVVKDFLADNALTTEPAIYTIQENSSLNSYVWQLNNGYMAIIVMPINNRNFYDQPVYSVVYVANLSYLSYIN
ncbi:MAG: hypothetical protein E7593_06695 [Ruminococcaceae bacterium]|nr:hypothetical protein [Oscillospiraceae bacterium]